MLAYKMNNTVQAYDWGHPSYIKQFLGNDPAIPEPQAELWMGSHSKAPSEILLPNGGKKLNLLLEEDPEKWLGAKAMAAGWKDLPFLFKVLAAYKPLSIQCHPSKKAAEEGFAREEKLGIPLSASHRNYKDSNHKPEIICALTPFHGLAGFREASEIVSLLQGLRLSLEPEIDSIVQHLIQVAESGDLENLCKTILEYRPKEKELLGSIVAHITEIQARTPHEVYTWMEKSAKFFPGDIGLLFFCVLRLVHLQKGQAIFLPAGLLHAYVEGIGLELMANSDNVLRCGLSPKHIDIPELLANLDTQRKVEVLEPAAGSVLSGYDAPVPEFHLETLKGSSLLDLDRNGSPEILLCLEGSLVLGKDAERLELKKGECAYILPEEGKVYIDLKGEAARAYIPL